MARMIDSSYLLKHQRKVKFFGLGPDDESWGYAVPTEIIENAPTLIQPNEDGKDKNVPTNEPLMLKELSQCNDPVWIKRIADRNLSDSGWAIVEGPRCLTWLNGIPMSWEIRVWWPGSEVADYPKHEDYGKTWLAYRRPPEGEEKT